MVDERTCPQCGETKPATEWYAGRERRCKTCMLAKKKKQYADRKAGLLPTAQVIEARCLDCDTVKPAADFSVNHHRPNGLKHYCRACVGLRGWMVKHRITRDEALLLRARLESGCEACGSVVRLVVDHDHATGAIRGILCDDCNTTLGRTGDSVDRLMALAGYLMARVDMLAEVSH